MEATQWQIYCQKTFYVRFDNDEIIRLPIGSKVIPQSSIVHSCEMECFQKVSKLIGKYILSPSRLQVNIGSDTRKHLSRMYLDQDSMRHLSHAQLGHIFDRAIGEVIHRMTDTYSRFCKLDTFDGYAIEMSTAYGYINL